MLPIPIGTDRPQRYIPWMNFLLISANVFFYVLTHGTPSTNPHDTGMSPQWDPYLLNPTHLQLYQFITYQFLHENLAHIFFNMLFLYVFGNNLNEKLGHLGYLAFYLTGGILAGCGQVLTSNAPTLGASGAISAVTGLFLVLLPRTNIRMVIWIIVYVDIWEVPSIYFIVFSILKDFLEPIFWGSSQIAHAAHIAGTVAGILIGFLLIFTHLVQRDHYDLLAMLDRWRRRRQYNALVAGGYDPFTPTISMRAKPSDPNPALNPQVQSLREEIPRLIRQQQLPVAASKYLELRSLDPRQVLAYEDQLDVANQLMANSQHAQAAAAYEDFLRIYTGGHQQDKIMLVLALIYARYLSNPQRAIELLRTVLPRLHDPAQRQWAEEELTHLSPPSPP